ncbi:MAG: hypothetical protein FWH46_03010 [Methanimicrococcus sp.]|nr:hypothetical protein [Methanimicrococcus sp.]
MANNNRKRGPARKEPVKEPVNKWIKYGAMFAIIIMVGSAMAAVFMYGWDELFNDPNKITEYPFSKVKGVHSDFTFTNAIDGSKYVPDGAVSIHITVVKEGDVISEEIQELFPEAEATKKMKASYTTGILEYYLLNSEENVNVTINGSKPSYENYSGYNVIFLNPSQRAIVGKTPINATFFNYAVDNTLGRKAIDVLTGKASGPSDFDDILSYADNVSNFEEIIVYTANRGSNYSQYYQRASIFENNSNFQFEAVVYKPTDQMRAEIQAFADNAPEDVTYNITQDDNMIKMYIDSPDYFLFLVETWAFYDFIGENTA